MWNSLFSFLQCAFYIYLFMINMVIALCLNPFLPVVKGCPPDKFLEFSTGRNIRFLFNLGVSMPSDLC